MDKRYYAAYGSNLNEEQMKDRCSDATKVGVAALNNYELLFKGSNSGNYLTVDFKVGSKVPIGVWEISAADEEELDYYEGCSGNFYYKDEVELEVILNEAKEIKKLKCLIYKMPEGRVVGAPTQDYVDRCLVGYRDFGFDERYILEAKVKSENVCKS